MKFFHFIENMPDQQKNEKETKVSRITHSVNAIIIGLWCVTWSQQLRMIFWNMTLSIDHKKLISIQCKLYQDQTKIEGEAYVSNWPVSSGSSSSSFPPVSVYLMLRWVRKSTKNGRLRFLLSWYRTNLNRNKISITYAEKNQFR